MKRLISFGITIGLLLVIIPNTISAQNQGLVERLDVICSQLQARSSSITTDFEQRQTQVSKAAEELQQKLDKKQQQSATELAELRYVNKTKRFELYKKLRAHTDNESDKLAVEAFISSMEKAVADRQQAYDLALKKFKENISSKYTQAIDVANISVQEFRANVKTVLSETSASCGSDEAAVDVRQKFVSGLKDARLNYSSNSSGISNLDIKALSSERDKELSDARGLFEQKVRKLTDELNSVLND